MLNSGVILVLLVDLQLSSMVLGYLRSTATAWSASQSSPRVCAKLRIGRILLANIRVNGRLRADAQRYMAPVVVLALC